MTTIKASEGIEIRVFDMWSTSGIDFNTLLYYAERDAVEMVPKGYGYTIQTSVMFGELKHSLKVGIPSLFQIDLLVFADVESELNYLALNKIQPFFIQHKHFQKNN